MPVESVDPAGLDLARLWRSNYDWYMSIHYRYPEQEHTRPLVSLAAESKAFAVRALAYAGVPLDALELVFDLLEGS